MIFFKKDSEILAKLYEDILEEGTSSHTTGKEIDELLDVLYTVNDYYRSNNKQEIARVDDSGSTIQIFPNDGSGKLFNFHKAQDKHPIRRAIRQILKNDLENVKGFVNRKFFRQYVQPILTGN